VVMAAVTSLLSSESLCVLLLISLSLARFPNSELTFNRKVFQHDLLFVSKTTSRPEIQGFMTPTINSFAKRSEDNRVVCVLSLHLLQKSTLALFLISLAFDVATNPGPTMNNPGDVPNFPCSCGLKIAHLNLRSILGKMDDLKLLLTDKPFDIFTISETCLHATCSKSLLYRFMFEISAISRREIAQKSPLVYTCDFHRELERDKHLQV